MKTEDIRQAVMQAVEKYELTPGEETSLRHMIAGLCAKESAEKLGISHDTIRKQRNMLYQKVGVNSAARLVAVVVGLEGAIE